MIEIGRTIISRDIFEEHFLCDLLKCKGACCIEGDSGAPLTKEEAQIIETEFPAYSEYLSGKHKHEIERQGFSVIDSDGDLVTPLINNRQCVYTYTDEKGILKCAIEKAFFDGKNYFSQTGFVSSFSNRITAYKRYDAVNYQELAICIPGKECGKSAKLPLYKFLKEPLIRKYGEEWYAEVALAAEYLENNK